MPLGRLPFNSRSGGNVMTAKPWEDMTVNQRIEALKKALHEQLEMIEQLKAQVRELSARLEGRSNS
jgi:predicted RNase H-like nuclease (RuvC/YqgF family)